jgi:hypothetical protein
VLSFIKAPAITCKAIISNCINSANCQSITLSTAHIEARFKELSNYLHFLNIEKKRFAVMASVSARGCK